MDGSASIGLEQALLGHSLGFAPFAAPTQVYVSLCLASHAPSETVPGLEASGGGYARMPATFALITPPTNIAANTTSIEFPQALSSWGQIGFFELWDAPIGGNRLYWGQLVDTADFTTPLVLQVSAGDIARFSAGTLGVQASTGAGGTVSIGAYLPLAGGQMAGPLLLAADPLDIMEAATKGYVDAHGGGTGGGPGFLPLSGGTMLSGASLGFTGSGTITGFGTDIGQAPVYSNYNSTGIPAIAYASRHIHYKSGGTSSADFWTHDFIRTATHTTSGAQAIVGNMRVSSVIPAGDGDSEWNFLAQTTTNATSTAAQAIGGTFQGTKNPGSKSSVWAGIFSAIDLTLQSSSAATGALAAIEIDVRASAADDGPNIVKFGGTGLRQHIQLSNKRQDTSTDAEISTNIFITAAEPLNARSLTVLGFGQGYQVYQVVDTRGAAAPTGYPDPPASVRMSAGHILDFNGGTTLKSRAGNYLQYTTTGNPRLRYMVGTNEVWWIGNDGTTSLGAVDTASKNVSMGSSYNAWGTDAGNFGNTAAGYQALAAFVGGAGHNNTAIGQSAMAAAVSVLASTAVGSNALAQDATGSFNTGVGSNAGWVIQGGFGNTAVGHGALGGDDFTPAPNTAGQNTNIGGWSGQEITTGSGNTAVGASSLLFTTTGSQNVAIGSYAQAGGPGTTAVATVNSTATNNTAVGTFALRNNTQNSMVAVGWQTLTKSTTGIQNTAIGYRVLETSVADTNNTGVGFQVLQFVNGGGANTIVGSRSFFQGTTIQHNTSVGSRNFEASATTASYNVVIGDGIAPLATTAHNNTLIGAGGIAASLVDGTGNIVIGVSIHADLPASAANTLRIQGGAAIPAIYGEDINQINGNSFIQVSGQFQIGGYGTRMGLRAGQLGMIVAPDLVGNVAPGVASAKLFFVAGTTAGTAKLVAQAGTNAALFTILDNIGGGV